MGVPSEDAENVAQLVGIKTAVNEFVAFDMLGKWKKETCLFSTNQRKSNIPKSISSRSNLLLKLYFNF